MSNFKFNLKQNIIICYVEIIGNAGSLCLKMALDTGAAYTMIPVEAAVSIGCDPIHSQHKVEITTGSGIEYVSIVSIPKFKAFGVEVKNIEVVCHNLPPQSPVEGLLGLNFLREANVIIDFSKNIIETK